VTLCETRPLVKARSV